MAALRQGKNRRVQVPVVAVVALKFQVEIPVLGWITKHQCGINELEIWWRFTLCTSHRCRLPGNACPSIFNDARLCILLTFFAHKIRWWNLRLSGLIPLQEGSSSCESWRGYFFFWRSGAFVVSLASSSDATRSVVTLLRLCQEGAVHAALEAGHDWYWLRYAAPCSQMVWDWIPSRWPLFYLWASVLRWLTVRYCLSCPISIIPSYPHYFIYDFPIFHSSMDWFKGKSTGNHRFSH